jgi:hypothetical protein
MAFSIEWKNICLAGSTATDFFKLLNYSILFVMTWFEALIRSFYLAIIENFSRNSSFWVFITSSFEATPLCTSRSYSMMLRFEILWLHSESISVILFWADSVVSKASAIEIEIGCSERCWDYSDIGIQSISSCFDFVKISSSPFWFSNLYLDATSYWFAISIFYLYY